MVQNESTHSVFDFEAMQETATEKGKVLCQQPQCACYALLKVQTKTTELQNHEEAQQVCDHTHHIQRSRTEGGKKV